MIEQINSESGRVYRVGDRHYPSVTTILKLYYEPIYREWSKSSANIEYRDARANIGSIAHNLIEQSLKSRSLPDCSSEPNKIARQVASYLMDKKITHCETPVFASDIQIAGTVDFYSSLTGTLYELKTLAPNKSSKSELQIAGYTMQVAAYHYCIAHIGLRIPERWILLFASQSLLKIVEISQLDLIKAFDKFMDYREQYRILYKR